MNHPLHGNHCDRLSLRGSDLVQPGPICVHLRPSASKHRVCSVSSLDISPTWIPWLHLASFGTKAQHGTTQSTNKHDNNDSGDSETVQSSGNIWVILFCRCQLSCVLPLPAWMKRCKGGCKDPRPSCLALVCLQSPCIVSVPPCFPSQSCQSLHYPFNTTFLHSHKKHKQPGSCPHAHVEHIVAGQCLTAFGISMFLNLDMFRLFRPSPLAKELLFAKFLAPKFDNSKGTFSQNFDVLLGSTWLSLAQLGQNSSRNFSGWWNTEVVHIQTQFPLKGQTDSKWTAFLYLWRTYITRGVFGTSLICRVA